MSPPEISNYYSANFFALIVMFPVLAPDFDPVFLSRSLQVQIQEPFKQGKINSVSSNSVLGKRAMHAWSLRSGVSAPSRPVAYLTLNLTFPFLIIQANLM